MVPINRLVTIGPATFSLHEHDLVRIGGVAADDRQRDLGAGLAAQRARPFEDRHVPRRLAVDRPDRVGGAQPRLLRREPSRAAMM